MARLLNATGYFSSILAAVCLTLAVLAAPVGEIRADTINDEGSTITCFVNCSESTGRTPPCANCVCINNGCPSDCICNIPFTIRSCACHVVTVSTD